MYDNCEANKIGNQQFYDAFAYLPQEDATLNLTPYELFCEAEKDEVDSALEIARQFGLSEGNIYSTSICDLSGGERKKVYLSRLLARENEFLFLDEPTNCLDSESVEILIEMMKKRKKGWLVITHDVKMFQKEKDVIVYSL